MVPQNETEIDDSGCLLTNQLLRWLANGTKLCGHQEALLKRGSCLNIWSKVAKDKLKKYWCGAIWSSGMRVLVRVTGTLNAESNQHLLLNNLLSIWDHDYLLLQDNATLTNLRPR